MDKNSTTPSQRNTLIKQSDIQPKKEVYSCSSADKVNQHLQQLENNSKVVDQRQLSPEEQLFTEDELARLINSDKLKSLMDNGDDLVRYLTREIDKYED